jgi:SNF2 family DNA or RNA helicase
MTLRDYQVDISDRAVKILRKYKIVYLAMEVRTGKTLTSLATAYLFGAIKVLFVTKKKAIEDIVKQAASLKFDMQIFVTNYEQLHNVEYGFDLVIIDEAHCLGAYPTPSIRAKELKRICVATPIIYLSGTPTPESYSQIFHQFWVSTFSPFANYKTFYKWAVDYVHVTKQWISGHAHNDYSNADQTIIDGSAKHLFLTYTQEQAGFESMVQEQILYVKMLPSTYALANRLRIDKIVTNKEGQSVIADTGAKMMQKLHQVYSGSVIVDEPEREAKAFDYSKAEFIRDYFKGKRIAIFYKFAAELAILSWVMGEQIGFDPDGFNTGKFDIFASQILSGREGINLSTADALVFFNIDFSATSYWQARARLQTKDREKESKIYWIFSEGVIEDKVYKAVCDKKDFTLEYFKSL